MPRSHLNQHGAGALRGALQGGFTTVRDTRGADYGLALADGADQVRKAVREAIMSPGSIVRSPLPSATR
jgi:hypothetical protein